MRRTAPRRGSASAEPKNMRPPQLGRSGVRVVTIGLIILSLWTLSGFVGQVLTSAQMQRRQAEVRAQNAQLATENATLATQVADAQSPAYAERILREQRGYAREGDTVILPSFPQVTPTAAQAEATPVPTAVPVPNWQRWGAALFPSDEQ